MHRRAPAAEARSGDTLDQLGGFERFEVLANGGVGKAELAGKFRCCGALGALQALDDAALGAGEVVADIGDELQPNDRRLLGKSKLPKIAERGRPDKMTGQNE